MKKSLRILSTRKVYERQARGARSSSFRRQWNRRLPDGDNFMQLFYCPTSQNTSCFQIRSGTAVRKDTGEPASPERNQFTTAVAVVEVRRDEHTLPGQERRSSGGVGYRTHPSCARLDLCDVDNSRNCTEAFYLSVSCVRKESQPHEHNPLDCPLFSALKIWVRARRPIERSGALSSTDAHRGLHRCSRAREWMVNARKRCP